MSLYEQFFSDINKDFMFNMANNVLKKDHDITIDGNGSIREVYLQDMKDIFENNDYVEISDINKALLDLTIKKNRNSNIIEEGVGSDQSKEENKFSGYRKIDGDTSEKNEKNLSDLIKERESINISSHNDDGNDDGNDNTGTNIENLLKNVSGTKIESFVDEEPGKIEENVNAIATPIDSKIDISPENDGEVYANNLKLVSFSSNKRTSINSSRYNYSVDIIKGGIEPEKLHSLSRLIIPIEENYIFSLPILTLIIKELDIEVCLQQKDIIKNEYNTVGIYEPIENIIFNISYPLRKLSI